MSVHETEEQKVTKNIMADEFKYRLGDTKLRQWAKKAQKVTPDKIKQVVSEDVQRRMKKYTDRICIGKIWEDDTVQITEFVMKKVIEQSKKV